MAQPSKEKADKAHKVGKVPGGAKKTGPHWFLQENDVYDFEDEENPKLVHKGRYLKVYATSMVEVNGDIIFFDGMEEVLRFPLGTWSYMEHGFEENEETGENVNGD